MRWRESALRFDQHFVVSHSWLELKQELLVFWIVPSSFDIVSSKLTDSLDRIPQRD